MKNILVKTILLIVIFSCNGQKKEVTKDSLTTKTTEDWKAQLTDLEYYVLRNSGTEPAFSGKYDKFYEKGTYHCKGCNLALFNSENKFNSGTGWPSFDAAIKNNVETKIDYDLGIPRTEIHCKNCKSHLGHVFNDGPINTTGKRYCVNSVSLIFENKPE